MGRGPYQFQPHSLTGAFINAQAAAHAVLIDNKGLHFLGAFYIPHLNGVKMAPLDAGLAALALICIYYR